jgi:hypothetical protein
MITGGQLIALPLQYNADPEIIIKLLFLYIKI